MNTLKFWQEWDFYIVSKYLHTKYYKGKKSNFTVQKPDRQHQNQMMEVNFINNRTNQNHMPPDRMQWEKFLPKMHNLSLVMKKHQTNPNWGTFQKNNWPVFFKTVKVMKDKERLPQIWRDWEDLATKTKWNPRLDHGKIKRHYWKHWLYVKSEFSK